MTGTRDAIVATPPCLIIRLMLDDEANHGASDFAWRWHLPSGPLKDAGAPQGLCRCRGCASFSDAAKLLAACEEQAFAVVYSAPSKLALEGG
jgi:hypothetical protein